MAKNEILNLWTQEEKAKKFDEIALNYYNVNFGNFSKSQIDLLMFSIYLDKLIETNQNFDDYSLSKQLGIVQSSIRQLKKKKQLIYPRDYKWYEAFLEYCQNAQFDKSDRIVINIPDPNVYIELQNAIEEIGGYVEVQLNSKLLKIPPGYFVELLLKINQIANGLSEKENKQFKKEFIKELNKKLKSDKGIAEEITEGSHIKKLTKNGLKAVFGILGKTNPLFSLGSFIKELI